MWFSKLATPDAIGKPLVYSELPYAPKYKLNHYRDGTCNSTDFKTWSIAAGEDDYNIKNPCCLINNEGNQAITWTKQAQEAWVYLFHGAGRANYVAFLQLLADAVKG